MTTASPDSVELPESLREIRDDFLSLNQSEKLELLLEFSENLPDVPDGMVADDEWERVEECQSPVFIHVDTTTNPPHIYATAPREAPTTRGFASILVQGLQGLNNEEILRVPSDFPHTLGLAESVSLLRLRGMSGMLWRIKRHIEDAHQ
jgi:cysteine desulfuration protein SufE